MRTWTLAIAIYLLATVWPAVAAELGVVVTQLRSADGDVHIAVYDHAEGFPKGDGMMVERTAVIADDTARTVFHGLPPGVYAVAAFHDENGNDDFDTGLFGVPLEGYGFSNGAKAFLSAPAFSDAVVEVPAEGAEIKVPLTY